MVRPFALLGFSAYGALALCAALGPDAARPLGFLCLGLACAIALGRAVLGHKAGDRVYVKVNEKAGYYVVIKSIDKTAGDDTDQIRKY